MRKNFGNNHGEDQIISNIDYHKNTETIDKKKKNKLSYLCSDLGLAEHFNNSEITKDIYNTSLDNFLSAYLKEGQSYKFDRNLLEKGLAYSKTTNILLDKNSSLFTQIYNKKLKKIKNKKMEINELIKEIKTTINGTNKKEKIENEKLRQYLMKCRNPLIGYQSNPDIDKKYSNQNIKKKFNNKIKNHTIEDIAYNKLSLMIMRKFFDTFLNKNKEELGRENFKIKIADNYDTIMGGSHLIIRFKDKKTNKENQFVLHINTNGTQKKIPEEIIPYHYASSLGTKPMMMTMKTFDRNDKELFYKFINNSIKKIKENGSLSNNDIKECLNISGGEDNSTKIEKKIFQLLKNNANAA